MLLLPCRRKDNTLCTTASSSSDTETGLTKPNTAKQLHSFMKRERTNTHVRFVELCHSAIQIFHISVEHMWSAWPKSKIAGSSLVIWQPAAPGHPTYNIPNRNGRNSSSSSSEYRCAILYGCYCWAGRKCRNVLNGYGPRHSSRKAVTFALDQAFPRLRALELSQCLMRITRHVK